MVVQATCPRCKKVIYGYQWAKTKSNKNWLMNEAGDWHSCGGVEKKGKSKFPDIWAKSTYVPKYNSCGKCGGNLEQIHTKKTLDFYNTLVYETFGWFCNKCNMFPNITYSRNDELGNGPIEERTGPLVSSNRNDIIAELRKVKMEVSEKVVREGGNRQSGEKPLNWMCMNEDGTIKSGYKLTSELTDWFNNGGLEVIKELNERTILTEKVKPLE